MLEYDIKESMEPASAEQLSDLSVEEGWRLHLVLQEEGKFYWHFVRDRLTFIKTRHTYKTFMTSGLASQEQLNHFAEDGWIAQAVIRWGGGIYYYMIKEETPGK